MNGEKINIYRGKTILVAPLDWGLGHYTRCIPIIKAFVQAGANVIIAAEKHGTVLYELEFSSPKILPLEGYRVSYSKSRFFFPIHVLWQAPKIIRAIRNEKKWLKKIVEEYKIDLVFSDNRYGLYHHNVPCIFITHQLQILTGNKLLNSIVRTINYSYIEKFTECWVPDIEKDAGVAGLLSHPSTLPGIPVKYIGLLSRFSKTVTQKKYDLIVLLSGPEPQRSILESIILHQLKDSKLQTLVVRGLPGNAAKINSPSASVNILSHLPAFELNQAIQESEIVIARAGYSTIMDLLVLEKQAILIPTPGQKEQEYLAEYLSHKKWFYSCAQEDFNLADALTHAMSASINPIDNNSLTGENVLRLLANLKVEIVQQ